MNENKPKVLVVDDNTSNLMVIMTYLAEKGYTVYLSGNSREAFDIMNTYDIDLILLDIMMPGMTGLEMCRIIKETKEFSDIPVIFITAKAEEKDIVEGFKVGGVDYITKPFYKEELFVRIENHLRLKKIADVLKNQAKQARSSRNNMMSTLLELGKIIETNR